MVRVAVVVDGAELRSLAQALAAEKAGPGAVPDRHGDGVTEAYAHLLVQLREAGVTGVGVYEWTLQDAADRGDVFVVTPATLAAMDSPLARRLPDGAPPGSLVVGWSPGADPWLVQMLEEALPHVAVPLAVHGFIDGGAEGSEESRPGGPAEGGEPRAWLLKGASPAQVVLGLHPEELRAVHAAGLTVVPRLRGGDLSAPDELLRRLRGAAGSDGRVPGPEYGPILFWGTSVTGYPTAIRHVGELLAASGATVGLIEFSPQQGLEPLARATGFRTVRVHSITDREMAAGIAPRVAVDRWLRAVRERQVRLLYVRFYLPEPPGAGRATAASAIGASGPGAAVGSAPASRTVADMVEHNLAYIRRLTGELLAAGYGLGAPDPVPAPGSSLLALGWIALATGAGAGGVAWTTLSWLGAGFARTRTRGEAPGVLLRVDTACAAASAAGAIVTAAAFAGLWLKGHTVVARQGVALLAAVAFPVAAALTAVDISEALGGRAAGRGALAMRRRLAGALAGFAAAAAIALTGAAMVAALLTEVRFLAKIAEFRGVKLAHVAPLAALAFVLAARFFGPRAPGSVAASGGAWERLVGVARYWASRSVSLGELLVAAALAGILWIYVMRTGNDALPLPAFEASLRNLLEERLVARPRTKEFLIGHPALFIALTYWGVMVAGARARRLAAGALLLLGTIGPISMINTFAHAHSALAVSLARTAYGLLLGLFLGGAAVAAIEGVKRLGARKGAQRTAAGTGGAARGGFDALTGSR